MSKPKGGRGARERRRVEGETRNESWRSLTPGQQLVSLLSRRGDSKRQKAAIAAKLLKEENATRKHA